MRAVAWWTMGTDYGSRPAVTYRGHLGPVGTWPRDLDCWIGGAEPGHALIWSGPGSSLLFSPDFRAALDSLFTDADKQHLRWTPLQVRFDSGRREPMHHLHLDREPGYVDRMESAEWMGPDCVAEPALVASTLVGRRIVYPDIALSPVVAPELRKLILSFGLKIFTWRRARLTFPDNVEEALTKMPFVPYGIRVGELRPGPK